jgi:hypothetical protein
MRRTSLLCCFGFLFFSFGASLFAQAPAPGEAHEAALRLVRTMNLRPVLEETVSQSMPAGESREIARLLFADDKSFLEAYEAEAAGLYEKRFSAQEMRGLADFFAGDLGRKWVASQGERQGADHPPPLGPGVAAHGRGARLRDGAPRPQLRHRPREGR